jgi:hypothetical protein
VAVRKLKVFMIDECVYLNCIEDELLARDPSGVSVIIIDPDELSLFLGLP